MLAHFANYIEMLACEHSQYAFDVLKRDINRQCGVTPLGKESPLFNIAALLAAVLHYRL